MARITVAYDSLRDGRFPPVCCRTGVHTDNYSKWQFTETPGWTWILLPFGIAPFLIARLFLTKSFTGVVPISVAADRRVRRLARLAIVCGVAGIAFGIGGIVAWGWAVTGLLLLFVAFACMVAGFVSSPDARRDLERGSVELRNVHPTFVETIESAWRSSGGPAGQA